MPPVVVAIAAAYLSLRTFVGLGTPVLLGGDQGFFWTYAERMQRGELPYRDFFQFTLPGADVVHLAAFALFGPRVWATNALVVLLGASLAGACFSLARGVMDDAAAALATAVLVVAVFGEALTTTHHWWSTLFVLCAVLVAGSGARESRLALAGALLALATFCTQTHGLAALFALTVFVVWRGRRSGLPWRRLVGRVALVAGPYAVTLAVAMAYFVAAAGARVVWSCTVSYVVRSMTPSGAWAVGLPEALTWRSVPSLAPHLFVYAGVPVSYALALRARWGGAAATVETRDRLVLLWLVGVALLVEVSAGLSWVRVFAVAWPGVILLVWMLDRAATARRVLLAMAWLAVAGLGALLVRSTHRHHAARATLTDGETVATAPEIRDTLDWLTRHVVGAASLFAADRPSIYLPLGLRDPLYLDAAVPSPQTTIAQTTRAVSELEAARVEYVLWSAALEQASAEGAGEELAGMRPLGQYLHARYHLLRVLPDGDEAWQRN